MREDILSQLIDKYLDGKCTADEEATLFRWYNSAQNSKNAIGSLTEKQRNALKLKMLNRIRKSTYGKTPVFYMRRVFYYYGAAVLVAATLIAVNFSKIVHTDIRTEVAMAGPSTIHITNESNKIDKHVLPDYSIVWLKPQSTISYNQPFVNEFRKISLKGEAFFEVAKDAVHPFLISAGGVITRVVGTSFNVKANEGATTTEIDVVTGKVLVYMPSTSSKKPKGVYLLPQEKATYSKANHQLLKNESKKTALKIWQKSTLSFDNAPISDVVIKLNQVFDAKIVIADQNIKKYTLKADFTDVNLMTIMELLSTSLNVTYEMQGEEVILSEKTETDFTHLNPIE